MATARDEYAEFLTEIANAPGEYVPKAFYEAELDCLVFIERDVTSYAKRLNSTVTVILDASSNEMIGVKVKGICRLLARMERLRQRRRLIFSDDDLKLEIFLELGMISPIDDPSLAKYEEQLGRFDDVPVDRSELMTC
ncbi:MAG: hypothetical protein WD875_06680 [Pirellulales bacterium]